jgi:hypothetical protein
MTRALGLANEIRGSSRLTVEVERNGARVDYQFDFE